MPSSLASALGGACLALDRPSPSLRHAHHPSPLPPPAWCPGQGALESPRQCPASVVSSRPVAGVCRRPTQAWAAGLGQGQCRALEQDWSRQRTSGQSTCRPQRGTFRQRGFHQGGFHQGVSGQGVCVEAWPTGLGQVLGRRRIPNVVGRAGAGAGAIFAAEAPGPGPEALAVFKPISSSVELAAVVEPISSTVEAAAVAEPISGILEVAAVAEPISSTVELEATAEPISSTVEAAAVAEPSVEVETFAAPELASGAPVDQQAQTPNAGGWLFGPAPLAASVERAVEGEPLITESVAEQLAASDPLTSIFISVLFVLAAVGLVVLTSGVAYLGYADWRDKREVDELQKQKISDTEKAAPKKDSEVATEVALRPAKGFGKKPTK